jgi:mono/diheme cytochrome c family protein
MRILRLLGFLVVPVFGAGYVWSSVPGASQETSVKKEGLSAEELARAKTLFRGKCARCHGANGRGQTVPGKMLGVPDFTSGKWWDERDDEDDLVESITKGSGAMPAFDKKLTQLEICLLADYVRHFKQSEQRETLPGPIVTTSSPPTICNLNEIISAQSIMTSRWDQPVEFFTPVPFGCLEKSHGLGEIGVKLNETSAARERE